MTPEERQSVLDAEHLRLLTLFHYVSGGMTILMAAWFGFMIGMMSFVFAWAPKPVAAQKCGPVADPQPCAGGAEFEPPFEIFLAIFGFVALLLLALGIVQIISGRSIARRKRRVFSIVVAVPGLVFIPYGTLLSIFTFLVLERNSVRALYGPLGDSDEDRR